MKDILKLSYTPEHEMYDTVPNTRTGNIVRAISQQVEKELNEELDKVIEEKVEDFRRVLTSMKTVAMGKILSSIEISVRPDYTTDEINLNINLHPRRI